MSFIQISVWNLDKVEKNLDRMVKQIWIKEHGMSRSNTFFFKRPFSTYFYCLSLLDFKTFLRLCFSWEGRYSPRAGGQGSALQKREGKLGVFTVKISQNKMLHTDYSAASAYNAPWSQTLLKSHWKSYKKSIFRLRSISKNLLFFILFFQWV